ncbi:family 16 glycoside hydrolase [Calycomorphotria hydatis]|uniref:3-keto-alpha-glucoside-1,2-lyase/3-keto-2-hydroxy-glucal hydratase domain-containing protein n=1 Tax=Calycomorphotria hydatis TaxID=2528027 RepID=A0A517TEZ9_9PLAN|nr:family 16 glycoside hydrolase [Calycomorphotria hydatis]QDT66943.1 hypothetical protein V22_42150 [Calycomorphotria hydatis]
MKHFLLSVAVLWLLSGSVFAADTVILDDNFNREEKDPAKEQVGGGWSTNSKSRAKGVKQVDLADGAMHIVMAEVADHGVSVVHEADFRDATISLRFKLGEGDDLGVNIADMKEKSVHAGHICMPRVRLNKLEIIDMKTGRMRLEVRERSKAKKLTKEDKKLIKQKMKVFPIHLAADKWHDLKIEIRGEEMTVSIDGEEAGRFQSEGIGHPTKSRIRLAVNKEAWVDDVKIVRHE